MVIKELEKSIKEASQAYYEGNPIMTDIEFDELLEELRSKYPEHELLTKVGHGYEPGLRDVEHALKITRGLPKEKVEPSFTIQKGYITPKYDGSSVTLYYKNGKLIQAITRGDGITGKDVTDKLKLIVPNTIDNRIEVITGEWLLSFENAEKYYPNEVTIRNIATGILGRKTFTADEIKKCHFVAYRINKLKAEEFEYIDRLDILKLLRDNNFLTPDINIEYDAIKYEDLFNKYNQYSHKGYTFLYDGLVYDTGITINNNEVFYNNEVAYKIITQTAIVDVKEVEWNRSEKGKFKPVVIFNEVKLSGANIQRATGFNAKYILDNNIGTNTQLKICRSGEVIPTILNVIQSSKAELPKVCPDCGKELVWDGVDLVCDNSLCEANKYNTLFKYIKTISNIKSASTKVINALIDFENWKSIEDIYDDNIPLNTNFNILYSKDGLGDSSIKFIKKVFDSLFSEIKFDTWLMGLNIKNLSTKNANKFANNIKKFLDNEISKNPVADKERAFGLEELPNALYEIIIENRTYMSCIYRISKKYLIFNETETEEIESSLNVCITGKLSIGRRLLVAELSKKGIKETSIQKANILICNEPSNSSKYKYAINNNIPIMTENEFMNKYCK